MTETISISPAVADFDRPDPDAVRRLGALPTANIGDAMDRLGALDSRIQATWPGAKVAGPAFTVWTRAGDNAAIHAALRIAEPGDVIVVNGQGDESRALLGELIGGWAAAAGIVGFVLDGAVRDAADLAEIGMPVFARACTPAGPYKHGPGRLGVTIAVGGVAISLGDIVVGDADGVVVVPRADAEAVATAAEAVFADEARRREAITASRR
jgi:regulator of RNase E activity RraA